MRHAGALARALLDLSAGYGDELPIGYGGELPTGYGDELPAGYGGELPAGYGDVLPVIEEATAAEAGTEGTPFHQPAQVQIDKMCRLEKPRSDLGSGTDAVS